MMHQVSQTLTKSVIGCAMRVHSVLGPGLLESVYEACLAFELEREGMSVERQVAVPVTYRDTRVECGFRIDLLVDQVLILELKAVEQIAPIHLAPVMTYLRVTGLQLALLMNFNVVHMRDGVKRVVNGLAE